MVYVTLLCVRVFVTWVNAPIGLAFCIHPATLWLTKQSPIQGMVSYLHTITIDAMHSTNDKQANLAGNLVLLKVDSDHCHSGSYYYYITPSAIYHLYSHGAL